MKTRFARIEKGTKRESGLHTLVLAAAMGKYLTVDVWFVHIGNVSVSDHKTKKAAAEQAQQINAEIERLVSASGK